MRNLRKYGGEFCNNDEPFSFLMNYNVTNLYGTSMYLPLLFGEFEWMDSYSFDIFDAPDDDFGYSLEPDIHYPIYSHAKF